MRPGYDNRARQRQHAHPADPDGDPGWASRDKDRLLRSAALRALRGKTQSLEPDAIPHPLNRLTHSVAVAKIGRSIAGPLGADPDLVETACLAHDLGHPPFGHNGERALDDLAQPSGGFEANAQTLRILTRLAPAPAGTDETGGLNLTRATLDATCKYPWERGVGHRKYGAYTDDANTLQWIRAGHPEHGPCLEAQIMDWADDIANAVHDLADGIRAAAIPSVALADPTDTAALAVGHFTTASVAAAEQAAHQLAGFPYIQDLAACPYDGSPRAHAALARYTSAMTGQLVEAAITATRQRHPDQPLTRFTAELIVPPSAHAQVAILKALNLRYVLRDPARRARRQRQRVLLTELATHLHNRAPHALRPPFGRLWAAALDDPARLRVVVDQVAALTDQQAVAWHHRLIRSGAATRSTTAPATSGTPPTGSPGSPAHPHASGHPWCAANQRA
ncbi:deoxyguanosinetriphosphate triphosphohydrolase [Micromonospora sp. NPDC005324]|uniref:deoxyguanosinetriphosphate triphosphohydrolase n=1 Tax=Micromonospora sp. NPDC005324 TaxID=3157033 RepID=UPI0033BF5074